MRRTIPLLLAVLLLAGCSAQSPQDAYVSAVTKQAPEVLERGTTDELKELGAAICDGLDADRSAYDIAEDLSEQGWTLAEAGTVVVSAAETICPEHRDKVN